MEPLRVLQVVTYMGRGGLETMLMNYYRNLDREKIQFDFLVHRDFKADYDDEIRDLGGNIYHVPLLNPFSVEYWRRELEFFQKHPYKIVHAHLDCMSACPLKNAKKAGVPVRIAHAHNKSQDKNKKYPIKIFSKSRIPHSATHLFACGKDAGKWMFSGKPFQVMHNAIDTIQYQYNESIRKEIRDELKLGSEYIIGHVGRFGPQKNHDFLIDIFKEVSQMQEDSKLLLVGGGDGKQKIADKAKSLGLDKDIIFLGIRDDVHRILQGMDVYVFPSLYEGLPVTMIEAQAAGIPCVISEQVPEECIMTDLVTSLSLSKSAKDWAKVILQQRGILRTNHNAEIAEYGYDIKENAKKLQQFYLRESSNYE